MQLNLEKQSPNLNLVSTKQDVHSRATADEIVLAEVRECFGKVAWSHKTHECQASIYRTYHDRTVWAKIIVSTLAAGSGISTLFTESIACYFAAVLSSLVLFIDLIFKNRSYSDLANYHQITATRLWRVRESYQSLIATIVAGDNTLTETRNRMEELADILAEIYQTAPRTSDKAYRLATKKIHEGQCSCTDDEVDALLPERLRLRHV